MCFCMCILTGCTQMKNNVSKVITDNFKDIAKVDGVEKVLTETIENFTNIKNAINIDDIKATAQAKVFNETNSYQIYLNCQQNYTIKFNTVTNSNTDNSLFNYYDCVYSKDGSVEYLKVIGYNFAKNTTLKDFCVEHVFVRDVAVDADWYTCDVTNKVRYLAKTTEEQYSEIFRISDILGAVCTEENYKESSITGLISNVTEKLDVDMFNYNNEEILYLYESAETTSLPIIVCSDTMQVYKCTNFVNTSDTNLIEVMSYEIK